MYMCIWCIYIIINIICIIYIYMCTYAIPHWLLHEMLPYRWLESAWFSSKYRPASDTAFHGVSWSPSVWNTLEACDSLTSFFVVVGLICLGTYDTCVFPTRKNEKNNGSCFLHTILGDLKKIGYTGMPQLQCFKIPVSAFKLPCARAITIMGSSNFEKIQTWWTLQKNSPHMHVNVVQWCYNWYSSN